MLGIHGTPLVGLGLCIASQLLPLGDETNAWRVRGQQHCHDEDTHGYASGTP